MSRHLVVPLALAIGLTASAAPAPTPDAARAVAPATGRLRAAVDVAVPNVEQVVWSPDGKALAVRGVEGENPTPRQAASGVVVPRKNVVVVIPDVAGSPGQFVTFNLPKIGRLVAFTPDGKQLITDVREYNLISGFHRLQFWDVTADPPAGAARRSPARTVDLDSDQTHGYALAPDGKTFRTVYREENRQTPRSTTTTYTKLEVREVSLTTGDTTRTPLSVAGEYKAYALSPAGDRLAAIDAESDRVTVWDVARGEKVSAYDLPKDKDPDAAPGAGPGRRADRDRPPALVFSPDARRLACFRDPLPTVVLNADRGEPLPPPEKGDRLVADGGFTANGRLLVASGTRASEERRVVRETGFGNAGGVGFNGPGGAGPGGGPGGGRGGTTTQIMRTYSSNVGIWDVATGKRVRGWDRPATVVVHPAQPVVAVLEANDEGGVRLGLWEFPDR